MTLARDFKCKKHDDCVQVNELHTPLEAFLNMTAENKKELFMKAKAGRAASMALVLDN